MWNGELEMRNLESGAKSESKKKLMPKGVERSGKLPGQERFDANHSKVSLSDVSRSYCARNPISASAALTSAML
jgi:hypothetical protein